ncbi:MAG: helix-turn-helix transcriptional regulator [Oscillospiraceae bacterium]
MTISQRIFYILKQKGKKQKELAEYTGISTSAISAWNKNNTNPAAENLSTIADFLEVSLEYLITGKEKGICNNDPEQELIESYRKLSDFEKGEVLGDVKRRAANAEQVKRPNIQRVHQAARTYNREPIPTVIEADITPLLEAPDATDEY